MTQAASSHVSPLVLISKKLYSSRLRKPFPSRSIISNISDKAVLEGWKYRTMLKLMFPVSFNLWLSSLLELFWVINYFSNTKHLKRHDTFFFFFYKSHPSSPELLSKCQASIPIFIYESGFFGNLLFHFLESTASGERNYPINTSSKFPSPTKSLPQSKTNMWHILEF